jgi:transcriptional regulator with XRE-family HTH domain
MGEADLAKAFGVALREQRQHRELTQEALADLAQLNRTYVGLLERGQRQPSLETVFQLADALDVSASRLVSRTEALLK